MSKTTRATAHPAVPTQVTTRSFASSGGGGAGCACRSRVSFTPSGYEVRRRRGPPDGRACPIQGLWGRGGCARLTGVMYLGHAQAGPTKVTDDESHGDQH